jgi:hypothetical protein
MIELNLLPKDLKVTPAKKISSIKIKVPKIAPGPVIIGAISFILVSQMLLGLAAFMQQNRLTKLTAEVTTMASQGEVALALKKEVSELSKKFAIIDSLTAGSLIWSKKLYDLNNSVIDGVWLTSLSLEELAPQGVPGQAAPVYGSAQMPGDTVGKQILILKGSAVSPTSEEETALVGKFIESLRNNKDFYGDFEDIKLSSIQRKKTGSMEVMDFTIICYFKSGRRYFEKLEGTNI